ncbi:hypothetical protein ANN_24579 [Periplaneta americana]|uniref:Per a allergen n=1 Tax=Periplaneta americana TaxID=6978 RepID=A0ABQ8S458_PERAM|nr:hypothetical protein ANN_24579 [Periplaneta americana]
MAGLCESGNEPAGSLKVICNRLDEQFPGHWIGRRGPVEWPARAPDLTLLDFFFCGYMKSLVFEEKTYQNEE